MVRIDGAALRSREVGNPGLREVRRDRTRFGGDYGSREYGNGMLEQAWLQLRWDEAVRARALALACRLDRQLEETSAVAKRPESRLAARLRAELQSAVAEGVETEGLFATVAAVHRQMAWLPKPKLPIGIRVFLRELFGGGWDEDLVVAALADARWPLAVRWEGQRPSIEATGLLGREREDVGATAGGEPKADEADVRPSLSGGAALPVAVIPQAEMRDPLMWPLVALQGALIGGWSDAAERIRERVGPGLWFALAEALLAGAQAEDQQLAALWNRGRDELVADQTLREDVKELVEALADGVLISAKRVGRQAERRPLQAGDGVSRGVPERGQTRSERSGDVANEPDIYEELAAVCDVPAEAVEILTAGWLNWYGNVAPALLAADDWERRRAIVDGVDDVLCRSLDVAAIHRFYATEGASL